MLSSVTSEMVVMATAEMTGEEPEMSPCRADSQTSLMGKACQNQPGRNQQLLRKSIGNCLQINCIQVMRSRYEMRPSMMIGFLPIRSARMPNGTARRRPALRISKIPLRSTSVKPYLEYHRRRSASLSRLQLETGL